MPGLRDLQAEFARVVSGGQGGSLAERVAQDGIAAVRRLSIYRNNVQTSLRRVLEGNFPATRRHAGAEAFDVVAGDFLRAHMPDQPQLLAWGSDFPNVLAMHPATSDRPWLADLARLEWLREQAYYAEDADPLSPAALAAIPVERYPELRLLLHPTARLLVSPWPIHDLWSRPDAQPRPATQHVLVVRPAMLVRTDLLTPGEHVLLAGLERSLVLAEAAEAALAAEPELDLQAALARHLAAGSFLSAG